MDRPFVKVFSPSGWDFSGEPIVQQVKVASDGLRGNDLRTFVKRAGHHFAESFSKLDPKPGDIPIHLIAMGATEFYGPNRNSDGFQNNALKKYHDTFAKHARWYRDHQNKNPDASYGVVKQSHYNERMRRVELIVFLNGTKEAAARNGGLLADLEMEKLGKDQDLPVSMSCRVPFDVCSHCGNRAKHRGEYCLGIDEGGLCKAGGLRHNIGRLTDDHDHPVLHADNPDPCFFDISKVTRGADRIAFTCGLLKAAGASRALLGGAAIAEALGVTAPDGLDATGAVAEMIALAYKMAAHETELEKRGTDRHVLAFIGQAPTSWVTQEGKLGETLQALARAKVAMPLAGFLEVLTRDREKAAHVAEATRSSLRGVYSRLIKSGQLTQLIESCPFIPSERLAPLEVRRWAETKAAEYGLDKAHVERRMFQGAIRQGALPRISPALVKESGAVSTLAAQYAVYKLAFVLATRPKDADPDLTLKLCVAQNYA